MNMPTVLLAGTVTPWKGNALQKGRYYVTADDVPLFRIVNATAAGLGAAIADDIASIRAPGTAMDRDAVVAHVAAMRMDHGRSVYGTYFIPANHPEMFPGADIDALADDLHAYCITERPLGA
jgi:hypothetical protein